MVFLLKVIVGSILAAGIGLLFAMISWDADGAENFYHKNYSVTGLMVLVVLAATALWAMIKF